MAEFYKGFDLVSRTYIPDCSCDGIHLRHRKTGLEVFHLTADDDENLFAFAFRTPNKKSDGTAHIIEHSVFCGSERYPLKDPFMALENQSVQTFMNALTFPDKTVYPASSMLPADYFNLMRVYGDAVFFPLLREEIFLQEGRRVELDARGKPAIQGVVFNEMKGNYSSFLNVASDAVDRSLVPDTVYAKDSGGDPMEIARLSYSNFRAFHKKYYVPSNCLLFLYGNIPTERQLQFVQENVLDRIGARDASHSKGRFKGRSKQGRAARGPDLKEMLLSETQKPFKRMRVRRESGPLDAGSSGESALLSWLWGNSDDMDAYAESVFLGGLLCGHDGSPLSKALLNSGLGKDISSVSGSDARGRQISFSIGMLGVKAEDEEKLRAFIMDELGRICREGVSREDVESTFNSIDFDNREIKRFQEPFSLVLMRRALRSWNYGGGPEKCLFVRKAFDSLKERIQSDEKFIQKLIKKYFLENKCCAWTVVTPDKNYLAEREKKEGEIAEKMAARLGAERIKAEAASLKKFQSQDDDLSLLPHIRPANLKVFPESFKARRRDITVRAGKGGSDCGGSVPLFASTENTNGIVYATAAFPLDVFSPGDYPYLPFFAYILNELGWKGLNWEKTSGLIARTCGAFSTTVFSSTCPNSPGARAMKKANSAIAGRQWLFCKIKMLSDKTDEAFGLMRDCIQGANFDDKKRIRTLAAELLRDMESSVVPSGHIFASGRSACLVNRESAIDELWCGISQILAMRKIKAEISSDISGLVSKMKEISSRVFSSGAVLDIVADRESMPRALKAASRFARELNLKAPAPRLRSADDEFYALTRLSSGGSPSASKAKELSSVPPAQTARAGNAARQSAAVSSIEAIQTAGLVGFASMTFRASRYGTREYVAEKVLAHFLTGGFLWEKIRMAGGAYGAFAQTDPLNECWTFSTYRDPAPAQSLKAFDLCLEQAAQFSFDRETVEKAVTGTYSGEIQPRTPAGRGNTAFLRQLYCMDGEEKKEKMRILKTITGDDLHAAAVRLLKFRKSGARCSVITPGLKKNEEFKEFTGNFERFVLL